MEPETNTRKKSEGQNKRINEKYILRADERNTMRGSIIIIKKVNIAEVNKIM